MPPHADTASITRRAAIGALAAGGAAFALFGPRGGAAKAPPGRIVLDYWEKWTRHEGDAMVAIVEAFNRSQDRIFVRYLVTSDIGQKSLVAIAGGRPPDLIGLYAFNVPAYAESGAIIPLDDPALAPRFGMSLEQYTPGVRGVMTHQTQRGRVGDGEHGGRIDSGPSSPSRVLPLSSSAARWFACVNTAGSVAMYYNRALFREVGLDPDAPPRTIAELDEAHARLTKRDSAGRLTRAGFLHREPGWWSWIWGYSFGGSIYDPASERATLDTTPNIRAYEWMQTYARSLGVSDVTTFAEGFGNYFTPENPFLTGKVAIIVQGPWIANLIDAFKPDLDYGVAPFPVAQELYDAAAPIGAIDTDVLVIPRGARHPEAAMEFIAFTQRRDNTEALARAHCKPSPLVDVSPEFTASHPNRGIGVHYDLFKSPRAYVPPRTRVWQQFKDEFDSVVQRMWRLELPASEALAAAQPRVQSLIDAAIQMRRRRYG